jgi:hypothetical protein
MVVVLLLSWRQGIRRIVLHRRLMKLRREGNWSTFSAGHVARSGSLICFWASGRLAQGRRSSFRQTIFVAFDEAVFVACEMRVSHRWTNDLVFQRSADDPEFTVWPFKYGSIIAEPRHCMALEWCGVRSERVVEMLTERGWRAGLRDV